MCRSIKVLRRPAPPVTQEEVAAAALQFVRKVSGYHKPSQSNQAAFDSAVREIARTTEHLLASLETSRGAATPRVRRSIDTSPADSVS